MNDVDFERLLSEVHIVAKKNIPCLRDLIFNHFYEECMYAKRANELTKVYTDQLYAKFVNRIW